MRAHDSNTDELLRRTEGGDHSVVGALTSRHRTRMRQFVAVLPDSRVIPCVEPSDVVQESLAAASHALSDYLRTRPLPFYPWLRQIACKRLGQPHNQPFVAEKRSVEREQRIRVGLSDASVAALARRLISPVSTPSQAVHKAEQRSMVRQALDSMPSTDREVLVLWYLEELTMVEVAAALKLTPAGVKSRHRRALLRLTQRLTAKMEES